MKKLFIFSAIILSLFFTGCETDSCPDCTIKNPKYEQSDLIIQSGGFNSENYVWENWQFSTNRVDKK